MQHKSPSAYKTIGEVSSALDIPAHVLRFWEKKFKQIKPYKNNGRRYYSPQDIQTIENIKFLLYEKGLTINGVKIHLAEKPQKLSASISPQTTEEIIPKELMNSIKSTIQAIKNIKSQLQKGLYE
jgi:DNA-binding transcriptional MerR regulator